MSEGVSAPRLHVISVGNLGRAAIDALRDHFALSLVEIDRGSSQELFRWSDFADPINREIDEASGWVLLLREGEVVTPSLAVEIERIAVDKPVAWAFRLESLLHYCGRPLYRRQRKEGGEIRLFHGRKCRFLPRGSTKVLQSRGTVVRIAVPLERDLHDSRESHLRALEAEGVPHSPLRRFLVFLSRLWRDRWRLTGPSVRFHWREAGWDRGALSDGSSDAEK